MKKFLMLIAALLIIGCAADRSERGDLTDFLPKSSAVILKLQDPDLFFDNLRNNSFLKENKDVLLPSGLQQELEALKIAPHKNPSFLSFSSGPDKTEFLLITDGIQAHPDSLGAEAPEKIKVGTYNAARYLFENQEIFVSLKDSVFLFSNSKDLLKESLEQNSLLTGSPDFAKALKAASATRPVIFVNHKKASGLIKKYLPKDPAGLFSSFTNWTSLDLDMSQSGIKLNGITTAGDSLSLINSFRNVGAVKNTFSAITPASAGGFLSLTFRNYDQFKKNLNQVEEVDEQILQNELLLNSEEAGTIWLKEDEVLVLKILDLETARLSLSSENSVTEDFRGIKIVEMEDALRFDLLDHFTGSPENLKYFAFLDSYVLFAEQPEAIKEIVIATQNEQVLEKNSAFISASEGLSSEASLLLVINNKALPQQFSSEEKVKLQELSLGAYPVSALQLIYQEDFAHVHGVLPKVQSGTGEQAVAQATSVSLAAKVATGPYFFKNHRTDGLDVAVQDEQNTLYLISPAGKIYWKRKLDSRILGEIHSVDLFRNGRIQLAFTTQEGLHVIDRDGNNVKPFPLQFQDPVTQPLAVFDYDNNRDYRFVVTQDREVLMFDRRGRRVRGFEFSKAADKILHPPKHIRIGRKDYILIAEASGEVNLLSRTGQTRIPVDEKIAVSENQWFEHDGKFFSTTARGERVSIDQKGRIQKEILNLPEGHKVDATEKMFVSLSENELDINGEKIVLDFGLYTAPRIFSINNSIFINLTDIQAQKVYLFNSRGQLLKGFPVYGNSIIDLGNADKDEAMEFVVKGEEDSILLYEFPAKESES